MTCPEITDALDFSSAPPVVEVEFGCGEYPVGPCPDGAVEARLSPVSRITLRGERCADGSLPGARCR